MIQLFFCQPQLFCINKVYVFVIISPYFGVTYIVDDILNSGKAHDFHSLLHEDPLQNHLLFAFLPVQNIAHKSCVLFGKVSQIQHSVWIAILSLLYIESQHSSIAVAFNGCYCLLQNRSYGFKNWWRYDFSPRAPLFGGPGDPLTSSANIWKNNKSLSYINWINISSSPLFN